MKQEIFRMHHVSFFEKNNLELKDFNLHIFSGEIVSLIPINNQGLESFLRLLRQNLPLKAGFIYYKENLINSWKGEAQNFSKISVIQNQSSLVEGLSVFDNIFVLRPSFQSFFIRPKLLKEQLKPFFKELNLDISPSSYVDELSIFERLVVELIKAIVNGGKFVVLSEVGSFLSETDLLRFHNIIRYYAKKGVSFLYIAYHYEEARLISSRTVLMHNGAILKAVQPSDVSNYTNDYIDDVRNDIQRKEIIQNKPVFQVEDLHTESIKGLSFSLSETECIVLHTLSAQIYTDVLDIITGKAQIKEGKILLNGAPFDFSYSRKAAIINENPSVSMIFPELSYIDNLCFTIDHKLPEIWRNHQLKKGLKQQFATTLSFSSFEKTPEDISVEQKYELVYNRIILQKPKVVVCVQPFNKADVNLRIHIRNLIKKLIQHKIAVVILAVNLADSLSLADRLIRLTVEKTVEVYDKKDFSKISFSAPWVDLYKE